MTNTQKILTLKDKYKGSRIFCLGNGPSLKKTDLSLLKNEIVIGSNHVNKVFTKYDFFPQYCCITDRERILELRNNELLNHSQVIVSDNFSSYPELNFFTVEERNNYIFLRQWLKTECRPFEVVLPQLGYFYRMLMSNYYNFLKKEKSAEISLKESQGIVIQRFLGIRDKFSFDILDGVNLGQSVIFTTIQVAAYMGASEIYILGVDADYSGDKYCFQVDADQKFYTNPQFMLDPLGAMNPFFDIFKKSLAEKGVSLFNATLGGKLEILERRDFSSLFV
jgi:hypothetical protein